MNKKFFKINYILTMLTIATGIILTTNNFGMTTEKGQLFEALKINDSALLKQTFNKQESFSFDDDDDSFPIEKNTTENKIDLLIDLRIKKILEALSNGADINSRDPDYERSPLHYAYILGHYKIINFLKEKGAQGGSNIRDRFNRTPEYYSNIIQI